MTPDKLPLRYRRAAARATAILDSFGFPRTGPVVWDAEQAAFVVPYGEGEEGGVKFLGVRPFGAVQAARRERAKALGPERRARVAEGFGIFLDVVSVVAPIVGSAVGAGTRD